MRKTKALLLLTFLLAFVCPQVINAQGKTGDIVLNTKDMSLPKALKLLEKNTPYKVMYEVNEVRTYKVDRDVQAKDINGAMKQLLEKTGQ